MTAAVPGLHLPPDEDAGDESTLGGYAAVHKRPPAFEGIDGLSYSVELCADTTDDPAHPWGAYLLFLRWRRIGAPGIDAHLETDFIVRGDDEAIIAEAKRFAKAEGSGAERFEFQMLSGVRRDLQDALVREGYNVRVYVPFGTQWYPYLMRRLAERPANVAFMTGNIVKEVVGGRRASRNGAGRASGNGTRPRVGPGAS